MIDTTIYSWQCDKPDHFVIFSKVGDETPDCPKCHLTMEAYDLEMSPEGAGDLLATGQEIMTMGQRPFYWYNVTQIVSFHPNGRIDIQELKESES